MCQVKSRGKVKLMRPMGNVMVIYYRVDQQWKRAGTLCLHCLLFEPDAALAQAAEHQLWIRFWGQVIILQNTFLLP